MSKDSAGQVKRKKFWQAALRLPPAKDFAGPAKRPAAPMVPAAEKSVRDSSPKKPYAPVCVKVCAASSVHLRA